MSTPDSAGKGALMRVTYVVTIEYVEGQEPILSVSPSARIVSVLDPVISGQSSGPIRQGDDRSCGVRTPHEVHIWATPGGSPIRCLGVGAVVLSPADGGSDEHA